MLLSEWHESFDATIKNSFTVMRFKLVDSAMQAGNMRVAADTRIEKGDCTDETQKWVDVDGGHCFSIYQKEKDNPDYNPVDKEIYKKLTDKYEMDLEECTFSICLPITFGFPANTVCSK